MFALVASRFTSPAVTLAPSPIVASVVALATWIAIAAPMPTFAPPPSCVGFASVLLLRSDEAVKERSLVPPFTVAPPSTRALVVLVVTPTASAPATPMSVAPTPEVAVVDAVAVVGFDARIAAPPGAASVALPRCEVVVRSTRFTATATPTLSPPDAAFVALASAVALPCAFDRARSACAPAAVALLPPAIFASVSLVSQLNESAPAFATVPSGVLALPPPLPVVRADGESSVVDASSSSFALDPPGLAFAVVFAVPSASADTVTLFALTVAPPMRYAFVVSFTFARAMPAPPTAEVASPVVVAETVFVALIERSPAALREPPSIVAVAVLSSQVAAMAASLSVAACAPSPCASSVVVTLDAADSVALPPALIVEPVSVSVAVEEAGSVSDEPWRRNFSPEPLVTVRFDVAEKATSPALMVAEVRVRAAAPLALIELEPDPLAALSAESVIAPVPRFTVWPAATLMCSACTVRLTPSIVSVFRTTESLPESPMTVSEEVGAGNEMLSIVPGLDARMFPGIAPSASTVIVSSPALPVTVKSATGVATVIGSSPA